MAEWPAGVTEALVLSAIDGILRREDWDTVSVKVVLKKLEELVPGGAENSMRPHKKFVKVAVDDAMARILAEQGQAGEADSAEAEAAEEEADPAAASDGEAPDQEAAPADGAGAVEEEEAADEHPAEAETAVAEGEPAKKKRRVVDGDGDAAAAAGSKAAVGGSAVAGEEAEGEDAEDMKPDADAAVVVGKPTHKADGKLFYGAMKMRNESYAVGQDVYLENGRGLPYVARLQEIFVYAFAPSEVYFNARWYYREADVHEYAKLAGAKEEVRFEGKPLSAARKELFFSLHFDENHADCVLRPCSVHLREDRDSVSRLDLSSLHAYYATRAYDNKV